MPISNPVINSKGDSYRLGIPEIEQMVTTGVGQFRALASNPESVPDTSKIASRAKNILDKFRNLAKEAKNDVSSDVPSGSSAPKENYDFNVPAEDSKRVKDNIRDESNIQRPFDFSKLKSFSKLKFNLMLKAKKVESLLNQTKAKSERNRLHYLKAKIENDIEKILEAEKIVATMESGKWLNPEPKSEKDVGREGDTKRVKVQDVSEHKNNLNDLLLKAFLEKSPEGIKKMAIEEFEKTQKQNVEQAIDELSKQDEQYKKDINMLETALGKSANVSDDEIESIKQIAKEKKPGRSLEEWVKDLKKKDVGEKTIRQFKHIWEKAIEDGKGEEYAARAAIDILPKSALEEPTEVHGPEKSEKPLAKPKKAVKEDEIEEDEIDDKEEEDKEDKEEDKDKKKPPKKKIDIKEKMRKMREKRKIKPKKKIEKDEDEIEDKEVEVEDKIKDDLTAEFNRDKTKLSSFWVVKDYKNQPILKFTGADAYGKELFKEWDYFSSKVYGKALLEKIRKEGLKKVADLVNGKYSMTRHAKMIESNIKKQGSKKVDAGQSEVKKYVKDYTSKSSKPEIKKYLDKYVSLYKTRSKKAELENKELKEKLSELTKELNEYKKQAESLKDEKVLRVKAERALVLANKMAEKGHIKPEDIEKVAEQVTIMDEASYTMLEDLFTKTIESKTASISNNKTFKKKAGLSNLLLIPNKDETLKDKLSNLFMNKPKYAKLQNVLQKH